MMLDELHELRKINGQHPLGVKPRFIHEEERWDDLRKAIVRYADANLIVPIEWIEEYNELHKRITERMKNK